MKITKRQYQYLIKEQNELYQKAVNRYLDKIDFDVTDILDEDEVEQYVAIDKLVNEPYAEPLTEQEEQIIKEILK